MQVDWLVQMLITSFLTNEKNLKDTNNELIQ